MGGEKEEGAGPELNTGNHWLLSLLKDCSGILRAGEAAGIVWAGRQPAQPSRAWTGVCAAHGPSQSRARLVMGRLQSGQGQGRLLSHVSFTLNVDAHARVCIRCSCMYRLCPCVCVHVCRCRHMHTCAHMC